MPLPIRPLAFAPDFAAPRRPLLWDGRGISAGTPVATPAGPVAAERLQPGSLVLGPGGEMLALTEVRRLALPDMLLRRLGLDMPVEIAAGALGFGMPASPLVLGPAQCVRLGGGWIRADLLVDGRAIRVLDRGVPMVLLRHAGQAPFLAAGTPVGDGADGAPDIAAATSLLLRLASAPGLRGDEKGASGIRGNGLDGHVDHADRTGLAGWALDRAAPDRVVPLEVLVGGTVVAHALADRPRPDLPPVQLGGRMRHGFAVRFPAALPTARAWMVEVRRAGAGPTLPGTPLVLDAAACPPDRFDLALAAAQAGEAGATFLAGLIQAGLGARRR